MRIGRRRSWRILAVVALAATLVLAAVVGADARGEPATPTATSSATSATRAASPTAGQPAARRSGFAWHSGVFSHDAKRTVEFERSRGRPVDVLAVFPTRDSWEAIMEDWWMSPTAVPDGFAGTLAVGVPLFPDGGSLEQAASGVDAERWEELGSLIAARYPDAWVRPGWEMNIPNWPWAATPENVESYRAAFRHAATGIKRGGPGLRIVFNPNEGRGASLPDARMAYPGDDVVDVVGIDAYDWYPAYDADGWQEHRTKDQGWDFWADFAREHGKRFAVPEWGVMAGSEASGGDNPAYITQVLEWMGANADIMDFDAYFEETDDYCRCALSQNPRAAAAYAQALPRVAAAGMTAAPTEPAGSAPAAPTEPAGSAPAVPAPAATGAEATGGSDAPTPQGTPGDEATAAPAEEATEAVVPPDIIRRAGRGRYGRDESSRSAPPS